MIDSRQRFNRLFRRKDGQDRQQRRPSGELQRTESTSSYMQRRRRIYVNMELPPTEYDDEGKRISGHYVTNRIRTAKYTPLTFIPKNLFEQFRNVANLYFLLLVVLQCIPIFGVVEPAVSALPLMAILLITAIKDAIEDHRRSRSDNRVNGAKTLKLANWTNVNVEDTSGSRWHGLHIFLGFFCMLAGVENRYAHTYRLSITRKKPAQHPPPERRFSTATGRRSMSSTRPSSFAAPASDHSDQPVSQPSPREQRPDTPRQASPSSPRPAASKLLSTVRQRSDTLRSELSSMFKPPAIKRNRTRQPYRPGSIPHSVLYRTATSESAAGTAGAPASPAAAGAARRSSSLRRRPSSVHPGDEPCAELAPGDAPAAKCKVFWQQVRWEDLSAGDYVMLRNNDDVPADIVVLSTSETDNMCFIETQNLDGETNLKTRQGLTATADLRSVHDCERARFYIESEPPHANLYQYNAALRWDIDQPDDNQTTVSHQKTEAVTYNNILLRGSVLRNTQWLIGVVVFTGAETKIMLNSGRTPSKRSKIQKETNPHVIANFVILAIICIVSSVLDSVYFGTSGSMPFFDFQIRGTQANYSGFLTFWVTLILYQNIVPISLYISVEIVKTIAAYFIYCDIDLYHDVTDTPCIPKTWNISDDLGQIEYIFSDKTGTLTQNVMEFRKCTIDGESYGLSATEMDLTRQVTGGYSVGPDEKIDLENAEHAEQDRMAAVMKDMFKLQQGLFENKHVGPKPTFGDPKFFENLGQSDTPHAVAMIHFMSALALCHTVIAERPDDDNPDMIDYRATSPDEAALVATARDLGFSYLGRDANTLTVEVMGEIKTFELLETLEFNSTRKRMSVILKPSDSDRIILLCKGADSVIYERLCTEFGDQEELEKSQKRLQATTMDHLGAYANEGLRTLCLGYRFISAEEYKVWNKRYQEACASIYNREQKVDEVCEEIETNMLLMGGTAIEDRLQDGVPETIAELAQSGIRLWVLTGDKTETAINIAFSCNLITNDMRMLILKADNRTDTEKQLGEALIAAYDPKGDKKLALVIDGTTLKYALEDDYREKLLRLGMKCNSVVCCRVSPKQKAQVVTLVKRGLNVMTLAIGDGANDVSMIQEANVGIGISGVEGRQAVMASDYAIAQFRFLRKLLLVHGRWSYLRTAEMIMGFFYKNIVWTFVLFWFQIFCQFTGTMIFDYSLVTLYNLIFTSLPIIFLGIWDQDLSAGISLCYPELYRMGLRNDKFKVWRFWATIFDSIFQSAVCFFFPYMLLIAGAPDKAGYISNGVYETGTVMSSIAVIVANLFVGLSLYSFTWIQIGIIALSILVYYAFVGIYAQFNTFIFAGHDRLFAVGYYWLVLILTVFASFLPRVTALYYLHVYHPYDNDIVREIELVQKNGRYERRESLSTGRETGLPSHHHQQSSSPGS